MEGRFSVVPAVYLIFAQDNKVLLIRRFNTGYHDGEYSLPAGHVDGGEPATVAAIREAKEEVGVDVAEKDLKLVHTMHRYSDEPVSHERIDLFFQAGKWQGDLVNCEPHKCDELRWVEINNLPENMISEVKQALEYAAKDEPYSSFGFEKS